MGKVNIFWVPLCWPLLFLEVTYQFSRYKWNILLRKIPNFESVDILTACFINILEFNNFMNKEFRIQLCMGIYWASPISSSYFFLPFTTRRLTQIVKYQLGVRGQLVTRHVAIQAYHDDRDKRSQEIRTIVTMWRCRNSNPVIGSIVSSRPLPLLPRL